MTFPKHFVWGAAAASYQVKDDLALCLFAEKPGLTRARLEKFADENLIHYTDRPFFPLTEKARLPERKLLVYQHPRKLRQHVDGFCLWPSRHTEYCTWFWNEGACYGHPLVETICVWYRQARAGNANFLLNAGPDKRGLMPEYHRRFLAAAANELGLKV